MPSRSLFSCRRLTRSLWWHFPFPNSRCFHYPSNSWCILPPLSSWFLPFLCSEYICLDRLPPFVPLFNRAACKKDENKLSVPPLENCVVMVARGSQWIGEGGECRTTHATSHTPKLDSSRLQVSSQNSPPFPIWPFAHWLSFLHVKTAISRSIPIRLIYCSQ